MKTFATAASVLAVMSTTATAGPNNYVGTDDNGVITEYVDNNSNNVIFRDMATQDELDAAVTRLDAEDMRVRGGEVQGNTLVLTVGDMARSQGRPEIYTKEVEIDVSNLQGQDGEKGDKGDTGATGAEGQTGATGTQGKQGIDGVSGISLTSALAATNGNGVGVGVALGDVKEISAAISYTFDNNVSINFGVTYDSYERTVGTAAIGYQF